MRGLCVGLVEVGDEAEGVLEVPFDDVELQLEGGEALLDVVEFVRDPLLFASEEVEGDGARVVGFEELGALVQGAALAGDELLAFEAGVLA